MGEGGLCRVYLGVDKHLARTNVAIKLLKPALQGDPAQEEGLIYEGEITRAISEYHRDLPRVYDCGRSSTDVPYVALELIHGRDLSKCVLTDPADVFSGQRDPLTSPDPAVRWRAILRVLARACEAVHAAHQAGWCHMDLAPTNIMADRFLRGIPIDWSLAHPKDDPFPYRGGTVDCFSPEQAAIALNEIDRSSRYYAEARGTWTDVYNTGATLYILSTGRTNPYGVVEKRDIMMCAFEGAVLEPDFGPNVGHIAPPPEFQGLIRELCLDAMQHDPSRRIPSMSAFAARIEAGL